MIELVKKSSSKNTDEDEEYKKMKQRILTIISQSLQDDIFYEERFNVNFLSCLWIMNICFYSYL